MKKYSLIREQFVAAETGTVWSFFSNPHNLSVITPAEMNFKVLTSNLPQKIYSGLIINYTVSPLWSITLNWMTEIKDVKEGEFFIDDQRKGPYSLWRHKHTFIASGQGTLMKDEVEYALPFSFLGRLIQFLVVKKKLNDIFNYRSKMIAEIFSTTNKTLS